MRAGVGSGEQMEAWVCEAPRLSSVLHFSGDRERGARLP